MKYLTEHSYEGEKKIVLHVNSEQRYVDAIIWEAL
jgi:hypothetical protein